MSESSSPFDQHHEFLYVFLQSFSFEQKARHHVEESSGKRGRRRTFDSGTEVDMFDIKKFERESISHVGFGYIMQPRESQIGLEFRSLKRWEIGARQHRKLIVEFSSVTQRKQSVSKYREIGAGDKTPCMYSDTSAWLTESTYTENVGSSQPSDLQ